MPKVLHVRLLLIGFVAALAGCATVALAQSMPRLDQHGRWLVDERGRVVMLRGGNLHLPGDGKPEGRPDAERRVCSPLKASTACVWCCSSIA